MTFSLFQFVVFAVVACGGILVGTYTAVAGPQVILKLDDMKHRNGELVAGWQMTLDYLDENSIPATIGLVCNTLDNAPSSYIETLKALQATGRYELWNHGWSHTRDKVAGTYEFKGTSYEYQVERFARSQQLAAEVLGFELIGFGAPYNQTDDATARVISEHPEIRWWMYPPSKAEVPDGVTPLYRIGKINIEIPVHDPNPEALREAYPDYQDEPVLIIQGHPMSWGTGDKFEKFKQVIAFLQSQGCSFVLARDYTP